LLSARLVALARSQHPPTAHALRHRQDRLVASPRLDHLIGTNQFFADLIAHACAHSGPQLARWWSEWQTAAAFHQCIHPDGHGVWTDGNRSVGFFLEHDNGTESLPRLAAKLDAYAQLRRADGPAYPVLLWLPSPAREANLWQRLATEPSTGVMVATAARRAGTTPPGRVWRLNGNAHSRRLRLAELPNDDSPPGRYNPGPPEPHSDPLTVTGAFG
jgi:hypothetical protein